MKDLPGELRRRRVMKVAAGYAVVAWIVAQVADLAADNFAAPAWLMPMLLILLALGLPVAVVLAWAYEMTPDGIRRDDGVDSAAASPRPVRALRQRSRAVVVSGLLATAVVVLIATVTSSIRRPDVLEAERTTAGASARADAPIPAKSVAVLPFVDMSEARDQEWFADGLTEEILNSLAALPELKVTARTSSFRFKGADHDIVAIADTLGVANVLEGSVRRLGDDLVVTAQLIQAADGTHLWSERYELRADDLFEVQRDVAEKVAATLDVFLDDAKREAMFSSGTRNVDAFEAYLQGLQVMMEWHDDPSAHAFDSANVHFDRALELDPSYAEAALGRMDPFAHILLDGLAAPYSQEEAAAMVQRDLAFAAANASSEPTRLVIEINRVYLSSAWHQLPGLVERLDATLPPGGTLLGATGWVSLVLPLADPGLARRLAEAGVEANPLDPAAWALLATPDLVEGDVEGALATVRQGRRIAGDHRWLREAEIFAHSLAGRREEMTAALERHVDVHDGARAWWEAARGDTVAARRIIDEHRATTGWPDEWFLFVYRELGNRGEAARLAARVDSLPLGPSLLLRMVAECGCVPFDLADTPNFRARLAEAGLALPPARP